ncbi:MAG: 30S ribosomal protein S17 [Nanoarchaeota archaeon]
MEKSKTKPEQKGRDIGIDVAQPASACTDRHCPFHGELKVRGRIFSGPVIRDVVHKSTMIEFPRKLYIQKYERFEKRRTRIKAHVPPCIDAGKGDFVRIMETRKISKTKSFVVIEVRKNESP